MYNVKDFEEVKKNYRNFWNKEYIGRPYIQLSAPKNGVTSRYVYDDLSYVKRIRAIEKGDYEGEVRKFEELAKSVMHYGEAFPCYCADISPDQYAAFYGAQIDARDGEWTTWVKRHMADNLADLDLTLNLDNPAILQLEKSIKVATEIADGNFMVQAPDYHSNLDALSALITPTNLCFELMDHPELLEEKLNAINNDFKTLYDVFYKAGNGDKLGSTGWIPMYCEGRYSIIQCDFSCMMSPDDARKYVIPSIEKEAESLDRMFYHYDGKMALGHFEDVLAIEKLDGIQWVPGAGEKRTIYWMDILKRIQEKGKSVWISDWSKEEILADTELDPRLTMFSLHLGSEAEAEDFMEKLERKYR